MLIGLQMHRLIWFSVVYIMSYSCFDMTWLFSVWDQTKCSRFNWLWYNATTYAFYHEETSYENSLLVQQTGGLALSSLTHVMKSLTPNAKGIFLLLAEYQLENKDNSTYIGKEGVVSPKKFRPSIKKCLLYPYLPFLNHHTQNIFGTAGKFNFFCSIFIILPLTQKVFRYNLHLVKISNLHSVSQAPFRLHSFRCKGSMPLRKKASFSATSVQLRSCRKAS